MLEANLEPSGILQLCPGAANITFVCTNDDPSSDMLTWRVYDQNHVNGFLYVFASSSALHTEQSEGIFTVVLNSKNPLMSTATLTNNNFDPQQNGTNLACANTTSSTPSPSQGDFAFLILKGTCIYWLYIVFLLCTLVR